MSLSSDINTTSTALSDIKTAIIAKGVTPTGNITTYATAIANIQTEPTLASLTVTPSTTAQTLTPPSGTDGYNTVTVSAVTASIDSDIVASNIKSGCNILGVNGTVTELVGTTTTITQNGTYAPASPSNGFTSVSVNVAGTQPSGTYTITANGTYDVTNYASVNVSVSGGFSGWTTLSSISVDCSVEEIVDYSHDLDVMVFQQYVASIIPANSMYISTTTFDSFTQGITAFIINDVTHFWGSMANDDIYIAYVNSIQPEFQYSAINYRLLFQTDVETTIENGEITIPGCGLEVYDANYGYQLAAIIDLTFHFNI